MKSCVVAISELTENDGRDEWNLLMTEDKIRAWDFKQCLVNADAWWSKENRAWDWIESRYIAKHDENAWDELSWQETLDFIASEIVNHKGPDDELITSWLEFHTNRELSE